ncbi:MBL fold metallo-hydrolase [Clostridioides difficile]|nr:MBL fold metallo-hydrolase [Clostridioides difficile]
MKIKENVLMLDSTRGANCFIVFDKEITLIDTGLPFMGKGIIKELEILGIQLTDIKHILLTHHDVDHMSNIKLLKEHTGAKVWAHMEDIPFIIGEKERPGFKKFIGKTISKRIIKDVEPYRDDMQVGNIKIIHTPGHTPGHVCMLFEDVLFAGDLVKNKKGNIIPYPNLWNWDSEKMMKSVNDLENLKYNWICMSHGSPCAKE